MALDQSMATQRPTYGHTTNNEYTMATSLIERTTTKTKSNTDLPREFKPIEEVGGMAVIAKDFMCTYTLISVLPCIFQGHSKICSLFCARHFGGQSIAGG